MSNPEMKDKPTRTTAIRLPRSARISLGVFGGGAWLAGGSAVFVPESGDLGAVALILGGMVLVLIATVGRVPSRVTTKDVSWDFSDFVEAADDASPKERERLANELLAKSTSESDPAQRLANHLYAGLHFEEVAIGAVIDVLKRVTNEVVSLSRSTDADADAGFDAYIDVGDRTLAIDVKYSLREEMIRRTVNKAAMRALNKHIDAVLVVTQKSGAVIRRHSESPVPVLVLGISDIDLLPTLLLDAGVIQRG